MALPTQAPPGFIIIKRCKVLRFADLGASSGAYWCLLWDSLVPNQGLNFQPIEIPDCECLGAARLGDCCKLLGGPSQHEIAYVQKIRNQPRSARITQMSAVSEKLFRVPSGSDSNSFELVFSEAGGGLTLMTGPILILHTMVLHITHGPVHGPKI